MFKWISRLFDSPKGPPTSEPDDWEAKLLWLPVGHPENPFTHEVLDCRVVALNFLSATEDSGVLDRFEQLRRSDGSELQGHLPENLLTFDCDLRFRTAAPPKDGPLLQAGAMEGKWDFFLYANHLYLRRSWTGKLIYVAELELAEGEVIVRRIHCDSVVVFESEAYALEDFRFVITTHICQTLVPFPIVPAMAKDHVKAIALHGFSVYGRFAEFGAYLVPSQTI